jgi:hypothetical protein
MGKYCSASGIETETSGLIYQNAITNLSNQLTNASFQVKKYF